MAYTVTVSGLRKAYGSHTVLDGIDLSVESGSVFALLGPNGAGKTTMVKILSTLVRPDSGTAQVAGHDLLGDPNGVRRSISLTGQYAAVDEVLTAEENLIMMARLHRLRPPEARRRTRELLAIFDLTDAAHRRVKTFSGGMRRRVDLAISLLGRPALVFLDEPTTGLDPRSREQVWETVRTVVGAGSTVFLTTQYLEEADRLADQVAMLNGGRIVADGTSDELKSSVSGEIAYLEFADPASAAEAVLTLGPDAAPDQFDRTGVLVPTDGSAEHVRTLLDRLADRDVQAARVSLQRPSLDDVFFSLTQHPVDRVPDNRSTPSNPDPSNPTKEAVR